MLLEGPFDITFCILFFVLELILGGSCTLSVLFPLMSLFWLLVTSEVSFAVAAAVTVSSEGCDTTRCGEGFEVKLTTPEDEAFGQRMIRDDRVTRGSWKARGRWMQCDTALAASM